MQLNDIYQFEENTLIRIKADNELQNYFEINNQYIEATGKSWTNLVWLDSKRLNKVWNQPFLVDYPEDTEPESYKSYQLQLFVRNGFDFHETYGFLVVLMDINSGACYCSRIFRQNDFVITSDNFLYESNLWSVAATFHIPNITRSLTIGIREIKTDELSFTGDNYGYVYDFPNSYLPLINEKPMDESISSVLSVDENFFLTISVKSIFNDSVEDGIKAYLGLKRDDPSALEVSHQVIYGNDDIGYFDLMVKNNISNYLPFKIGLDLVPFKDSDKKVTITVVTTFKISTYIMERTNSIDVDVYDVINPLIESLRPLPTTKNVVTVVNENVINQTVINANTEREIIYISTPTYIETLKDDVIEVNDGQNISWKDTTRPMQLIIDEGNSIQKLTTRVTADGTYYFDTSKLVPVDKQKDFKVVDMNGTTVRSGIIKPTKSLLLNNVKVQGSKVINTDTIQS